MPAMIESKRKF